MKQLGILDSAFINLEHANTPQQIGGFGIYDPSTAPGGFVRFKSVLANVERRLIQLPVFRTRLVEVPLGLDKPYWVLDENFDVEFHLRHISLPQPGDWRQLCIQIARLHARPLDMSKPLWECYVIEGLDNIEGLPKGAFAIYTKMHHALVDGAGGQAFMTALHDLEPEPSSSLIPDAAKEATFAPGQLGNVDLVVNALKNNLQLTVDVTRGGFKLAGELLRVASRIYKNELPAIPTGTPKSRFDEPVSPHRVFDASLFNLDDFKFIRRQTGTTINDVAVAVVAGALREYLLFHGELPEDSLAANMPVNTRTRKGETDDNNQVGSIMSVLHTDIADPLERLEALGNSLTDAKQFIDTPLADPLKIAGVFNPFISKAVSNWYAEREMTRKLPLGTCGVITNVMGPPFPLYSAGAKLVQYYCLGLLTAGGGLFHAVFSTNGTVSISALADRKAMPDPEFYRQCIDRSFAELKAAVEEKAGITAEEAAAQALAAKKIEAAEAAKAAQAMQVQSSNKAKTKAKAKAKPKPKAKAKLKTRAKTPAKPKAASKAASAADKQTKAPAKKKAASKRKPATKKLAQTAQAKSTAKASQKGAAKTAASAKPKSKSKIKPKAKAKAAPSVEVTPAPSVSSEAPLH